MAYNEKLVNRLDSVIKRKKGFVKMKMFGGVGIFQNGTMCGIVDSSGRLFLRAGAGNRAMFEAAGSERHGKMPYFSVPDAVRDDAGLLRDWAKASATAAREAKK